MSKEKTLRNAQIHFQIQCLERALASAREEKLIVWYKRRILKLKSLLVGN